MEDRVRVVTLTICRVEGEYTGLGERLAEVAFKVVLPEGHREVERLGMAELYRWPGGTTTRVICPALTPCQRKAVRRRVRAIMARCLEEGGEQNGKDQTIQRSMGVPGMRSGV